MSRMERLPSAERPRERLLREGPRALSEVELVALVLGSGAAGRDVFELAEILVASGGGEGVRGLARLAPGTLLSVPGIGPARAAAVLAAFELGRRAQEARFPAVVRSGNDLLALVAPLLEGLDHEEFWVVSLGVRGEVLGRSRVGLGGVSHTPADPRSVLREAVRAGASAVAVAHNHPSGDPAPSAVDWRLTEDLAQAAQVLGISVWDHVIVGRSAFYSFRAADLAETGLGDGLGSEQH